jgi:3-oxoacyl-[acyl-carrier protein] reductase
MSEVAIVTGGSRGIGRAIAVALAAKGMSVGINYRSGADEAKETLRLVEEAGGEGICVAADVSSKEDVDRMFSEVESAFGPVNVLVNNAGIRRDGLALSMKDDAWDEVIAINLFGTFACCRRALKGMVRARYGRIVNVSSVAGVSGSPGQANYSAAKAGVIGLTKSLAREVASRNITVNAIAPGVVETELTTSLPEKRYEELIGTVPAGRAGTPEEVASLTAHLCDASSSYTTGAVFVIDGALTA